MDVGMTGCVERMSPRVSSLELYEVHKNERKLFLRERLLYTSLCYISDTNPRGLGIY